MARKASARIIIRQSKASSVLPVTPQKKRITDSAGLLVQVTGEWLVPHPVTAGTDGVA